WTIARERNAVVKAERTLLPELDRQRHDTIARPVGRARHRGDGVFCGIDCDRLLEGKPALKRGRLLARPGSDLGLLRARGEIGVRLRIGHPFHAAAEPPLRRAGLY